MLFLQICQVTGGDLEAVGNLGAGEKAVTHHAASFFSQSLHGVSAVRGQKMLGIGMASSMMHSSQRKPKVRDSSAGQPISLQFRCGSTWRLHAMHV
jgi:hypothetical protein